MSLHLTLLEVAALAALFLRGLPCCTTTEIIGYMEPSSEDTGEGSDINADTGSETGEDGDTGTDAAKDTDEDEGSEPGVPTDMDSQTDSFSRVFLEITFDDDDGGVNTFEEPEWVWNSVEGTLDLDVEFTESPDWRTIDYWVGRDIWPGGVDWTGAAVLEIRARVLRADGGFMRLYVQSIEEESEIAETWLWLTRDYDLLEVDWTVFTLDMRDAPLSRLNLEEFTKIGFQVHAPPADPPAGDPDTLYPLDEPARAVVQVDHIVVRGD